MGCGALLCTLSLIGKFYVYILYTQWLVVPAWGCFDGDVFDLEPFSVEFVELSVVVLMV